MHVRENIGITGTELQWFSNYLCNRSLTVELYGKFYENIPPLFIILN
jgi:hypothetical protein